MNTRFISILFLLFAAIAQSVSAENFLEIEGGDATAVGIYVKRLSDGKVLVDHNSRMALCPASITKSFTSATALQLLGKDFRFLTKVELSGQRSAKRSSWDGNLVINAVGDPTTGSKQFKEAAAFTDSIIANLKRMGVTEISGTVVIRDAFPDAGPVIQWEIEDLAWPYGAGLFGFNWAGNTVFAYPNQGITKPASNLKMTVKPSIDNGGTDVLRGINSQNLTVWGSAKSRKDRAWAVETTIPDPAEVYAGILINRLKAAGIEISSKKADVDNDKGTRLYYHRSPVITDICRDLMKRSDNLFAEGVLRALNPGETRSECIKTEKEFWNERGISTKYLMLNDGSGLTRSNRIQPRMLGDMLEYMIKSDYAQDYLDFFPVSGVDGTMKTFMAKTRLKGRLAFKTGSMASVQTYAGYKLDADGHPTHVVVIMVNGFFCGRPALRQQIQKFLLKTFE